MTNESAPQSPNSEVSTGSVEHDEAPSVPVSSDSLAVPDTLPTATDALPSAPVVVKQRRAPKFKSFFWVGALVGVLIGLINGFATSGSMEFNRGVYITVSVALATLITTIITAVIVLVLEKRSLKVSEESSKVIG